MTGSDRGNEHRGGQECAPDTANGHSSSGTNEADQPAPAESAPPSIGKFVDALNSYAIDPTLWAELLHEFDHLEDYLQNWEPGELIAELSRAESLSWQIKQNGPDLTGPSFAYVLFDSNRRATGTSDNLAQLFEYLKLSESGELTFTTQGSQASLDAARKRLQSDRGGHSLVELSHPGHPYHRYGFLITENEFPPPLRRVASGATEALFIAEDQPSDRLKGVVQASFGLTASETAVTLKLAAGMTLKEAARELGISKNTARNHLQAVFDKSGINRQSDLILVITQLSVILTGTAGDGEGVRKAGPTQAPPQHFMILPDGRRLAYRTYGEPLGLPVVYVHETLGSSRLPPGTDAAAKALSLNLIAPERPGFGFSDIDPEFTFDSIGEDLLRLLDHLRIARCVLMGVMSGGGHALCFANRHPERVARLVLVSARPPQPMIGNLKNLTPLFTKMVAQPWLMSSFFNILRNRASSSIITGRLINSVYGSVPHDREFLEAHPEMFEHMATYTAESMTVTAAGVVNELRCFARAKDITPDNVDMPITAWHGAADRLATLGELKTYLADKQVAWRIFEEAGSLVFLEHWRELLDEVAATAADPSPADGSPTRS